MPVRGRERRSARRLHTTAPACGPKRGQLQCGRRGGATLPCALRRHHTDGSTRRHPHAQRRQRSFHCVTGGLAGCRAPAPLPRLLARRRAPSPRSCPPLMATAPACDCVHEDTALPDHAHVCYATKELRTSRQPMTISCTLGGKCCSARAVASHKEPTYWTIVTRVAATAAGLRRGYFFATVPGGRLPPLDVVVVHLWASSCAAGCSKQRQGGTGRGCAEAK